jgi:hypothetical protein
MPEFNEVLASLYSADHPQLIIIHGYGWKHEIGGNWYLKYVMDWANA